MEECKIILKYMFLSILIWNVLWKQLVFAEEDDKECTCVDMEMETFKVCKDWEDAPVKMDVKLTVHDDHGSLNGKIILGTEIIEGVEISIVIFLITPNGEEIVYSTGAVLCESFQEDKPWWAILQVFNVTECPIPKGEYKVEDVRVSLGGLKGFFTKDFVGMYSIAISVELAVEKIMCFLLGIEIYEETRLLSECRNPQDDC